MVEDDEKVNRCITKGDSPYCEHKDDCLFWKAPAWSAMDFCQFETHAMYCINMKAIKDSLVIAEPTKEEKLAANEKVYQAARDAISEWPQWKKDYAGIE